MRKSTHTPLYEAFRKKLVGMRQEAGLNQRQLAKKLDVPRSFVSRIELGERRLDVVEFFWVCRAFGVPAEKTAATLMREFKRLE